MSKASGLGDNLYVAGYDLSGDIGALGRISGGPAVLDVTGIDKSAHERIGGHRDGAIEFSSFFNPDSVAGGQSTNQEHVVLSALPTTDVHLMYCRGTALGDPAACMIGKQVNYDPTRATDGALTFAVNAQSNAYGLEWGVNLTAGKRTDSSAANGTTVDQTTVSTSFGWQAYLQVFSITGTSVTVTLEDSADNSVWAALTGGAFTAVASPGPGTQRLQGGSTATVRRYIRATTSGTFSSAIFAVTFVRNATAVTW